MDRIAVDRAVQARLENDALLQVAAEWFFELRSSDVTVERIAEWQEWLAADGANRQAFEHIESFWQMSGKITAPSWPADADVAADTYRGAVPVSEWRQHVAGWRTSGRRRVLSVIAASIVGMAAIGAWLALRTPSITVETAVGETRSLRLPDGSTVTVGGHTTIEARFAEQSRGIALERGEAFFEVAKDPVRPFVVRAGRTAVTAVGTAFNVRYAEHGVLVVAVAEGTVKISTADHDVTVNAGQQASVKDLAHAIAAVVPVTSESVAAWRDGRLQYMNESLEAVIADLARYSSRKIAISDLETGELRITGVVFQQNVDGWLSSLEATLPVQVVRDRNGSVEIRRVANSE